jgi:hypothetical protein
MTCQPERAGGPLLGFGALARFLGQQALGLIQFTFHHLHALRQVAQDVRRRLQLAPLVFQSRDIGRDRLPVQFPEVQVLAQLFQRRTAP